MVFIDFGRGVEITGRKADLNSQSGDLEIFQFLKLYEGNWKGNIKIANLWRRGRAPITKIKITVGMVFIDFGRGGRKLLVLEATPTHHFVS